MNIPDGWKLVPLDPTEEMINQGVSAFGGVYRAMIDAAPTPPAQDEPVAEVVSAFCGAGVGLKAYEGKLLPLPIGTKLYASPQSDRLRKAAEELIHTYDFACKEDGCLASNDHVEALRAALEGK